jgi:hypothetical protein
MKKNRIAVIGFEYDFHVGALSKVMAGDDRSNLKIVIWASRNGNKNQVKKVFPEVLWINESKAMHGDLEYIGKLINFFDYNFVTAPSGLSSLEIQHSAYTHTRYCGFMLSNSMKKSKYFNQLLDLAYTLVLHSEVKNVIFISPPHNIFDLMLYYAAIRIEGIRCWTFTQSLIGDLVYPRELTGSLFTDLSYLNNVKDENNNKKDIPDKLEHNNFTHDVTQFLVSRDRKNSSDLYISYWDNKILKSLPNIPYSAYCRTSLGYYFKKYLIKKYSLGNSNILDKVILRGEEVNIALLNYVGRLYRMCVMFFYKCIDLYFLKNRSFDKSILLALHFHPEQTTSPTSYFSPFEDILINSLSDQFQDYLIIVREHPAMLKKKTGLNYLKYRPINFVYAILGRNIKYLPANKCTIKREISGAEFVVATSGTIAYESILLGRPCFHFGISSLVGFPGVGFVSSPKEITDCIIARKKAELSLLELASIAKTYSKFLVLMRPTRSFVTGFHSTQFSCYDDYVDAFEETIRNLFDRF